MDFGIVTNNLASSRGGERQVCELAYHLDKMGNDVTVYTFEKRKECCYDYLLENVNLITLEKTWKYKSDHRLLEVINFPRWYNMTKELSKKIEDHDILNLQGVPMNWISNFTDIDSVWSCNEPFFYLQSAYNRGEWKYKPFFMIDKRLTKSKLICALDNRMKKMISTRFDNPIKTVGSGSSLVRPIKHIDNDYFDVINVGPICYQRRQYDMVRALANLNIPNLRVHLVGGIEFQEVFENIVDVAKHSDMELIYHGRVSSDELYNLFDIADLSIMASETQPWGIFPLETLLGGIPTITSTEIGMNEYIHNEEFVFEMGNVADLSSKIENVFNDYELSKRKTLKLSKEVDEKCSWKGYSKKMYNILKYVANSD